MRTLQMQTLKAGNFRLPGFNPQFDDLACRFWCVGNQRRCQRCRSKRQMRRADPLHIVHALDVAQHQAATAIDLEINKSG